MARDSRKRHCVSYEKMSPELAEVFAEKYPKGFNDYLPDLTKYPKPDGSFFYAVTVELETAIYLVKIKIETDNIDAVERWLDSDDEPEMDSDTLPDDDYSKYSSDDSEGK